MSFCTVTAYSHACLSYSSTCVQELQYHPLLERGIPSIASLFLGMPVRWGECMADLYLTNHCMYHVTPRVLTNQTACITWSLVCWPIRETAYITWSLVCWETVSFAGVSMFFAITNREFKFNLGVAVWCSRTDGSIPSLASYRMLWTCVRIVRLLLQWPCTHILWLFWTNR